MPKWDEEQEAKKGAQKGLFEKFMNFLSFEAEEISEDEEAASQEESVPRARETNTRRERERAKVLPLTNSNTTKPVRMVVSDPSNFDEVQSIVDHLKNKRAVVLNLEDTDKAVARRIDDFLSGAVYALEGSMQKVTNSSVFLLTPAHIEVSAPLRTEPKEPERTVPAGPKINPPFLRSDRDDRRQP